MKFRTLNDKEVALSILPEKYPVRSKEDCKSIGQYNLGKLIREIYGSGALILEEFPIPEERLWIDFFMPHHKMAFEFQGKQHDEFVKLFHGDKNGFEKSKARDQRKRKWCEVNDFRLIEVRGKITAKDLRQLILDSRNNE